MLFIEYVLFMNDSTFYFSDKECGELINPRFGFVEVNGRVVGSKAKYKCQKVKFFKLNSHETKVCKKKKIS